MSGQARGQPQEQPRRQPRPAVGCARAWREQHQAVSRRLARECEQQLRLGVSLLGQRQPDAERLSDAAPLGVSQQRVRPAPRGESTLGESGEHHRVEAEPAQLERREDSHAVPPDAADGHPRPGQRLAEYGGGLGELDLLAEHREARQSRRRIACLRRRLGAEHRLRDAREEVGPPAPRATLRRRCARLRQIPADVEQAAHGGKPQTHRVDLAGDLVLVVHGLPAARPEALEPGLQTAAPAREAGRPLVDPGHDPRLPGLVQPDRRLPRLARVTERAGGEQVDHRTPRERRTGRGRETVGQPGEHAHSRAAIGQTAGHGEPGVSQRRCRPLDVLAVRDHHRAVPGRGPTLQRREHRTRRLACLGAFV